MVRYTEATFQNFTKPPSTTEETQLGNAERMVKEAINAHPKLKYLDKEIFGQGSYANNTNVKKNSDIDINVMLNSSFFYDLPKNKTREDLNLTPSTYTFKDYKDTVEEALVDKFGRREVTRNNKCITIAGNNYRAETDVVPTWQHRRYQDNGNYVVGTKFIPDSGFAIQNYPKQHITNGKEKHKDTLRRFKRSVRIIKRIRYDMIDSGEFVSDGITSFLLECLFWNVPNNYYNKETTWANRMKSILTYLYQQTEEESHTKEWGEVSELLYLFRPSKKWTVSEVHTFIGSLYKYTKLEYA